MKALSVTQPWATIICTGVKDVENRTWDRIQTPSRILIHATSAKIPGNFENDPSEQVSNAKNARLMGQIPDYKDMPVGAIIGYVECYDVKTDADSIWAQAGLYHWCLRDARLFDEPIYGIKGARGNLFEVPEIDENNLPPSHEWICNYPEVQGDTLILPVSDEVMAQIEAGEDHITFDLTILTENMFINPETGQPFEYSKIELVGKNKTITKKFDGVDIAPYLLPGDKTVPIPDYNDPNILWSLCAVYFKD